MHESNLQLTDYFQLLLLQIEYIYDIDIKDI